MNEFLFQYHAVSPTTWVYLSSLLMIGLFFKFNRFWSVRNLDLLMLILLSPGLLMVLFGNHLQERGAKQLREQTSQIMANDDGIRDIDNGSSAHDQPSPAGAADNSPASEGTDGGHAIEVSDSAKSTDAVSSKADQAAEEVAAAEIELPEDVVKGRRLELGGFVWLFGIGVLWLIRLLIDPAMVRRPLLVPNLSIGGMSFIGCALFIFLMANVIARRAPVSLDIAAVDEVTATVAATAADTSDEAVVLRLDAVMQNHPTKGPGYAAIKMLPTSANKVVAVLAHFAIVLGLTLVGYRHFDNISAGIAAATIYLMLPYTSQLTGRVDHVLPGALLVWGVLTYRRPVIAGFCVGAAAGTIYYPLFLLPLWLSFYWQRGLWRFLIGFSIAIGIMVLALVFVAPAETSFFSDVRRMFGVMLPQFDDLEGVWNGTIGGWPAYWRLPVLALFMVIAFSFIFWPAQKNLGTLLSCTAAIMLGSQFWHGYGGGLYIAWYLPLLLLTIFRPNLEDRMAQTVLADGWFPRRRP
ncbi:MAG: glycosyltransferase family 87 protein [Pirellulaceae bacterium]